MVKLTNSVGECLHKECHFLHTYAYRIRDGDAKIWDVEIMPNATIHIYRPYIGLYCRLIVDKFRLINPRDLWSPDNCRDIIRRSHRAFRYAPRDIWEMRLGLRLVEEDHRIVEFIPIDLITKEMRDIALQSMDIYEAIHNLNFIYEWE